MANLDKTPLELGYFSNRYGSVQIICKRVEVRAYNTLVFNATLQDDIFRESLFLEKMEELKSMECE